MNKNYSIEEATARLKITARTLHYYEEIGLIEPACRTEGGHRLYDEAVIQRLEHILRLKHHMGSSLQEIRTILEAEEALDQLRLQYLQETSDAGKTKILEESMELLQQIVHRIDEKMDKLNVLKSNLVARMERVREIHDTDRPRGQE